MPSGTVRWFNPARGFGFIQPDDGSKDGFVHISALEASELKRLLGGRKVRFEVERPRNAELAAANQKAG
jgi:CspA family cold shock protein